MTQRNGNIGRDDFVGMDIDSQGTRHGFSTFISNARGTQLEVLEGGTADNITWAGDWKAVTQRTRNGWNCEMAIPFALMRYPRGATSFGMIFYRLIGRETSLQSWPYMPAAGVDNATEPQFLDTFTGIAPPFFAPRPIFLPYTLVTGGTGNSARTGLDIKYPLSTTITGVGTLYPDFQTIEQDVTNINFSYNEKLLTDRRPFFAEGSNFFPAQDLFYSRRITTFDGGLKVAGKQNDTTVGFLSTGARGDDSQSTAVLNVQQDIGQFSHVLVDAVDDVQRGLPSNQTAKLEGFYGRQYGQDILGLQFDHVPTWEGGRAQGSKDFYQIANSHINGKPHFYLNYEDTGPDFISNLGYNPEINRRGEQAKISQENQYDKGWLQQYYTGLTVDTYQYHTGGFFHNQQSGYYGINTRDGLNYELDYGLGARNQPDSVTSLTDKYYDHVATGTFGWGGKTLYQGGSLSDSFGRQEGQNYNFLSFSQGIFVARPFNVQVNYNRLVLGGASSTQTILTGTYRLTAERTLGARIVNQSGVDQGGGLGTNIYFSFGQHVRAGNDIYLLFGDPNSPKTRGKLTLKFIRPF